ncbi:MAG: Hsp20/alpha crystallin family protein [Gammaproteobacteria bacterium]|nr:Hsp20/alpha crystallin family protein [Gammaproteobacteria bacterium]
MFGFASAFDGGLLREFRRLEQEMDEMLGQRSWPAGVRLASRGTYPPMNVGLTPENVEIYLFAAGLDPAQLEISVEKNLLTVAGERKVPEQKGATWYRQERFDGAFRRVISLPDDVDPERVTAKYRDGVLQITAGRRQTARARQIQIQ